MLTLTWSQVVLDGAAASRPPCREDMGAGARQPEEHGARWGSLIRKIEWAWGAPVLAADTYNGRVGFQALPQGGLTGEVCVMPFRAQLFSSLNPFAGVKKPQVAVFPGTGSALLLAGHEGNEEAPAKDHEQKYSQWPECQGGQRDGMEVPTASLLPHVLEDLAST